tara:strand:+ start:2314 stop:2841 length:528 start_codon:yes stop_codon:yes gene_type:complete
MNHMLNRIFFVLILGTVFSSCNNDKKKGKTASDKNEILLDSLSSPNLELTDYPKEFISDYQLEDWEGFEKLHQSMERLKELNFDGIQVDLIALSSHIKKLRSGPLPRELEIPQIKSRLKVVEMQVQKARYFTQHYKTDSLIPSLSLLYQYYNGFILRMVALQSENQEFESKGDRE